MFYNILVDTLPLLQNLSAQMVFEPAGNAGVPELSERKQKALCASDVVLPNGKQITLLKTLLSSACERNCNYCPFRAGRDYQRVTLKPAEMAIAFMALQRAGIVQGLFLSSGVSGGGIHTQDYLLATAEILRKKYHYPGYIHLKLMPGAQKAQVEAAMQLSDRVSINLEAPNSTRLQKLAPGKVFLEELLQPMIWTKEIRNNQDPHLGWKGRWPSITTQFVVGAVGESDLELLQTTAYLHSNMSLSRAYYSIFQPVKDTPFAEMPAGPTEREHHLYQASFLLRDYGFDLEELPFDPSGNLPQISDPKTIWAQQHLLNNPVEVNHADHQELMRIPGIGPKNAAAIMKARKKGNISTLEDLHKLGINTTRPARFILLNGKRPNHQLTFW